MIYCSKCGKPIDEDVNYCPYCGAAVFRHSATAQPSQASSSSMPPPPPSRSGIDSLLNSRHVQDYWLRRLFAYIIDSIIISGVVLFFTAIFFIPTLIAQIANGNINLLSYASSGSFPLFSGLFMILYFTISEITYGTTFGKSLLSLKVTALDGKRPDIGQAIIRNISKIYWILLLLDVVFGLATQIDFKQKFSDKYANTIVVDK